MCGITGWVSYDSDLTQRQDTIDAMTGTMACRGPRRLGHLGAPARRTGPPQARHHRPPRRQAADVRADTERRRFDGLQR